MVWEGREGGWHGGGGGWEGGGGGRGEDVGEGPESGLPWGPCWLSAGLGVGLPQSLSRYV